MRCKYVCTSAKLPNPPTLAAWGLGTASSDPDATGSAYRELLPGKQCLGPSRGMLLMFMIQTFRSRCKPTHLKNLHRSFSRNIASASPSPTFRGHSPKPVSRSRWGISSTYSRQESSEKTQPS